MKISSYNLRKHILRKLVSVKRKEKMKERVGYNQQIKLIFWGVVWMFKGIVQSKKGEW